jgi:ribonuclease III
MGEHLADLKTLEEKLGVTFKNRAVLVNALMHSSYVNENPGGVSNERLEFLGDAVLGLIIAERLYETLPRAVEGELTQRRAALISRDSMDHLARSIGLGEYLLLGRGEEVTGGRTKTANLSGAMEAVIAAIYLDSGLEAARRAILRLMQELITRVTLAAKEIDYKSELQELTQDRGRGTPVYRPAGETGPDHERIFTVEVFIKEKAYATGTGKSKKIAEMQAAERALVILRKEQ